MQNGAEIGPTLSARKETERREFLLDLRGLQCGGEPANQLGYHLSWRSGRRDHPTEELNRKILVTELGDGRHIGQRCGAPTRGCR